MRALACGSAFMGGACWIARLFLEGVAADAAFWAGIALLALAVLGLGLQAVPRAPAWLQVIVGLGSVGLAGSVLVTIRAELDPETVDAVAGGVAVVLFVVLAMRWYDARPRRRRHGSHSR